MYRRILVPLDGSEVARAILPYVTELASALGAEVVFFRVLPATGVVADVAREEELQARAALRDEMLGFKERNITASFSIRHSDDPAKEIIDYADKNDANLIAMSTHGRSGLPRTVFGSVADKVLRGSSVPILLIRAPGAVSGPPS